MKEFFNDFLFSIAVSFYNTGGKTLFLPSLLNNLLWTDTVGICRLLPVKEQALEVCTKIKS